MENFNIPRVQQQDFVDIVNEGDLTDEYVVNLMDEFGISFNNTSVDYEASKLYNNNNSMQDVMNFSGLEGSYQHVVPNHEIISPVMPVNSESSEQTMTSPMGSPYFINLEDSPAGFVPESMQMNSSPAMATNYSQDSWYSSSPSEASPCSITSAGSPVGVYGDVSPAMPTNFEASGYALPLPLTLTSSMPMGQSPAGVFAEPEAPLKKRRGRKPKSAAEKAAAPSRQQTKNKRPKVYEIDHPFADKEMERKRQNAVNARRHRVMQKEAVETLEHRLADCTIEKEILIHEKEELHNKVAKLTQQLEAFQRYFGMQCVPVVRFFPDGQ